MYVCHSVGCILQSDSFILQSDRSMQTATDLWPFEDSRHLPACGLLRTAKCAQQWPVTDF